MAHRRQLFQPPQLHWTHQPLGQHRNLSFFSWDPREDYFGGYDHRLKAGTAWVGNHYVSPGMKYWADGNNPSGLKTNEGLTDDSGRYIELMAGFYTDNQPDYSWLQPYETKRGSMIWFPIRSWTALLCQPQQTMNYFLDGTRLDVRLNTTSLTERLASVEAEDRKCWCSFSIGPAEPQKIDVSLPAERLKSRSTSACMRTMGILYRYT